MAHAQLPKAVLCGWQIKQRISRENYCAGNLVSSDLLLLHTMLINSSVMPKLVCMHIILQPDYISICSQAWQQSLEY